MAKKKLHPADIADRENVAKAVEFTAYLRRGPFEKIVERAATLAEAAAMAAEIERANPGRTALVYAILPTRVSIPVPPDMREAALNPKKENTMTSTDKRAAALEIAAAATEAGIAAVDSQLDAIAPETAAPAKKAAKAKKAVAVDHSASNKLIADAIARDPELAAKAKAPAKPKAEKKPAQAKAPKEKAVKAEKPKGDAKPTGKRAAILEAAQKGKLPPAPDFSAPTHARFRKKLDEVIALAKAGDIAALRAFEINPVSSSPKAIAKYRDLAVIALEAKAAKGASA